MTDESVPAARRAAIVIAGGLSERMGRDKALIRFRGRTLLENTLSAATAAAEKVVVVAAVAQSLPDLGGAVTLLRDRENSAGPLVAVARGLEAVPDRTAWIFLLATDLPLLSAPLLERLATLATIHGLAVPMLDGEPQPLCAAYAAEALRAAVPRVIERGRRSLRALLQELGGHRVTLEELLADAALQAHDPELRGLRDADYPEDLPSP